MSPASDVTAADRPLVSLLLIGFNQQRTIADAIRGALAQTYRPLEILVSDDASSDATFQVMQRALDGYAGPHRVELNRNAYNLGIGGHLNLLVSRSRGELLVVAAGDDVSLPQRCERVVQAWLAHDRRIDLIAAPLLDIDEQGREHGVIRPADLSRWRDARDWVAERPHVIGAAQAWTRRLFDRYGPLPARAMAEDMIMVFRAIGAGGAITLDEPLVQYRRGGVSRRVRTTSAGQVVQRLLRNNAHALVELSQLLADARRMEQIDAVEPALTRRLARERFIHDLFAASGSLDRLRLAAAAREVPAATRLRLLTYAAWPWALAPLFALKRLAMRSD